MKRLTSPTTLHLLLLSALYAGCGGAGSEAEYNTPSTGGAANAIAGSTASVKPRPETTSGSGGAKANPKPDGAAADGSSDTVTGGTKATEGATGGALNGSAGKAKPDEASGGMTNTNGGSTSGGTAENSGGAPDDSGGTTPDTDTPPPPPDSDGDGIIDEEDLCPKTPLGVRITSAGCDAATDKGAQIPWGQAVPASALRAVPATASVETNGFMNLVVDANGQFPIVFRTLASNVANLGNGFHVSGAVLLDVPGGTVTLAEAEVTFEYGASAKDGLKTLYGRARVPFPDFGAPEDVELESPIAEFGLEQGKNLSQLNAPLVDDRRYLFFHFSDRLSAKVGGMTVEVPGGSEHTLVLDHTDPMFFMRASLSGVPGLPVELSDAGVGFSRQGRLPFVPTHTWGVPASSPANAASFSGQMYLEMAGGVQIPEIPISLTGAGVHVIDLDPARTGRTVFTDPENGLRLGANRSLGVELELIPSVAAFEMDIAEASLDLSLLKGAKTASISGVLYPGRSFFNDVVPILPSAKVNIAAAIASPTSDSRFALAGDVSIGLSKLTSFTGLSLSDVPLATSVLTIDENGLSIHGRAGASFLRSVGIGAGATFDAVFPGSAQASNWYVDVTGDLSVSGVSLNGTSTAHLDRSGVALSGRLSTALGGVAMAGRIDRNGVNLTGSAGVTIPIVAGRKEMRSIVNGAVCGYSVVQNGAVCGFETITGFAECGVNYVRECVGHGRCGTPSCLGAAKSCPDPDRPLSCPQEVTIPDFNYGTFRGNVRLTIGSNGLSSALEGSYCPVAGACQTLPVSSVDVSSSRACVQVPGIPQTFCAKF